MEFSWILIALTILIFSAKTSDSPFESKNVLVVVFSNLKLPEFFSLLYLNKETYENRNFLVKYYIDPKLDGKNAKKLFGKENVSIDEFYQTVKIVFKTFADWSLKTWACWRESENVYNVLCVKGQSCCFVKNTILEDESLDIVAKVYDQINGVLTIPSHIDKEWIGDKSITVRTVLFVLIKNSSSKENLLTKILTFIFKNPQPTANVDQNAIHVPIPRKQKCTWVRLRDLLFCAFSMFLLYIGASLFFYLA